MIFGACVGPEAKEVDWIQGMRALGAALGYTAIIESQHVAGNGRLTCAWLTATPAEIRPIPIVLPDRFLCATSGEKPDVIWQMHAHSSPVETSPAVNQVILSASLASGYLSVAVPPAWPEPIFFSKNSDMFLIGNDLRALPRPDGRTLDERGVFSLLQCGAALAPYTVFRQISRVPPGHRLEVGPGPAFSWDFVPLRSALAPGRAGNANEPEREFLHVLDRTLLGAPRPSTLFFSGGVDSAILASRAREIGRGDIRLINLSFSTGDPEGEHALRMAAALGLPCDQLVVDTADFLPVLDRVGQDYSFPFGDLSVLPTNVLVHAVRTTSDARVGVIEGTGADGAFGVGMSRRRWEQVYSIPRIFRQTMSGVYRTFQLWRAGRPAGHLGSASRRSMQWPLHVSAVLAFNALEGIMYTMPPRVRVAIDESIERYWHGFSTGLSPQERLSLLDVMFVCGGRFAAKSFSPLTALGIKPIYPFLEPDMVRFSSSLSWDQKCPAGVPKGLLKASLAKRVSPELVYRRKSGFSPPSYGSLFASPPMQEYLHDMVLSSSAGLSEFINVQQVRTLVNLARRPNALTLQACEFLWTLVFTVGWLTSAPHVTMG